MQINNVTLPLARGLRQIGKAVRLRGWERLLRALFHPDKQKQFAFEIPFNGFVYPAVADSIIDWNALFYGAYEAFELKFLAAFAASIEDAVFMDAGANVGHHTLYMAAHAGQVHAFEPNPAMWPRIEEKISVNGLENVVLHRCGLGSETAQFPLFLGPESGEASLLPGASRTFLSTSVQVSIVFGDVYFPKIGIQKLDVVKMDIEGFEKHAIDGMRASLENWRPMMMIELSETGKEQFGNFTDFVKTFPEGYGFFCCRLKPGLSIRNGLFPLDEADYGEFTGNIFCVPVENDNLFIELAGNAFACLAPHPAVQ
ncbi:MAG: FkbM family methyltransferase [Rhodospirillales bacterium]|jgi:FkbM family methyltransferase|nr:FkbM family methyltransferase [Rhodospirillales bacterium]